MKNLLITIFLTTVYYSTCLASYTNCPAHVSQNKNYYKAWTYLKNLKSRFTLDECTIEVHICEQTESPSDDDIIGDIIIKNKNGYQHYLTFIFPLNESKGLSVETKADQISMKYEYTDKNPDQIDGRYYRTKISFVSSNEVADVRRLLVSTYSTNEHDRLLGIVPVPFYTLCEK